jgi:fructose PTS system EIIBC or EIIC component
VNALRFLRPECVQLRLATSASAPTVDETEAQRRNRLNREKEAVMAELAELLGRSGQVANPSKFMRDLINRERKASTAVANGIAIPHVRTMQARSFIMGLARAQDAGVYFASLDGEPTRLFFLLASPPYEDRLYLQVYRELAGLIQDEEAMASLFTATAVQDVFNALRVHLDR